MASLRTQSAMRALRAAPSARLAVYSAPRRYNSSVTKAAAADSLVADPNQPDYSIHPDKASS